ncbi:MAG TPA: hypothetical protein DEQ40_18090 [Oxalobacteraceae bacterium]|jgi:hypothetical protein|nr:hypothetical protein [Oxalobacteraceae bacterium]
MIMQTQQSEDKPSIYQPMPTRRDLETAEIVEKGIALQALCGTKSAAEFLKFKMVAIDVVIRVLSRRSERRNDFRGIHADPVLAEHAFRQKRGNGAHSSKTIALAPDWRH